MQGERQPRITVSIPIIIMISSLDFFMCLFIYLFFYANNKTSGASFNQCALTEVFLWEGSVHFWLFVRERSRLL